MVQQEVQEALPAGAMRHRIDTWCEGAILAIALFVLAWAPLAVASVRPLEFLVIQGFTAVAVALWGIRIWVQRPFRLLWPPASWAVLAFALYALVRCRLVPVEYVGRQQLTHVLVYAAWFVIVLNNLTRRESANIVSIALISVGVILSFFALYQFATHSTKIWGETRPEQYWQRAGGTFFNPNNLAGYLEMLVPLALSYVVLGRLSATIKVLLAYSALVMLGGILVTVSRGGIIAAGVALILLCLILVIQGHFWLPGIVTGCFVLTLVFGVSNQFETLQKRFALAVKDDKLNDSRMLYWKGAEQLFQRDMLWGIGPGHFDVEFPSVRPQSAQLRPQYVHNDYLNTLCDWGLAGAAIITAAFALLYAGAFRAMRAVRKDQNDLHAKSSDRAAFVVGASVGLAGLLLHCIVEFNMQIPADALTAITLMGLLTAQWRFVTERFWMNPGFKGKIVLTALAVVTAVYLTAAGIHRGIESYWLWRATIEKASWERLLVDMKKAHEADPTNPDTDIHLGEAYWELSLGGDRGFEGQAKEAIQWFGKAMELNPYDSAPPVCIGLCLDWIGQAEKATPYFELATKRDPNSAYIATEYGRHCIALHDYKAAQRWFEHSIELEWSQFAYEELAMLKRHLADPLIVPSK